MDSALRTRFLKRLNFDFAAVDMREWGIKRSSSGRADWEIRGPTTWPRERAWWLDDDPVPVVGAHGRDCVHV